MTLFLNSSKLWQVRCKDPLHLSDICVRANYVYLATTECHKLDWPWCTRIFNPTGSNEYITKRVLQINAQTDHVICVMCLPVFVSSLQSSDICLPEVYAGHPVLHQVTYFARNFFFPPMNHCKKVTLYIWVVCYVSHTFHSTISSWTLQR